MNLLPEVAAYLAKARHALEVAGKLQAAGELADAAGKAYYAMFYAAQALLRAHGIEVVKHSTVASMLGHHFAKTGRLGPEFHRMYRCTIWLCSLQTNVPVYSRLSFPAPLASCLAGSAKSARISGLT